MRTADSNDATRATNGASLSIEARTEGAGRVVDEYRRRRALGEFVSERLLIADHPELMPELGQLLTTARDIHQAMLESETAGSLDAPLIPLSESELDAPIEIPLDGYAETDRSAVPVIRGYAIIEEISGGGQAVVFKAVQESTGRLVAIKVFLGGAFASSKHRGRFDRETHILAKLDHPNIVGILDRGRTTDGSFFFVMPFVAGCALDKFVAQLRIQHPDDVRRVIELFIKVADAVGEAHRRGVVHRDLKPSNVRVTDRGDPHVLDFGLARPLTDRNDDWRLRTVTTQGQVFGSLPWASPEQAEGRSDVNFFTDVYSLGVMLHEALSERFPYDVEGRVKEILDNILTAVPPRASASGIGWSAHVTPEMDGIVLKCLAKVPEQRYESASALARDLENCLAGRPTRGKLPRRWPRRRTLIIAMAMMSSLVTSIVGTITWFHRVAPAPEPIHVAELPSEINSVGMRLVRIGAGPFAMGPTASERTRDADDGRHNGNLSKPFFLATTEVTRAQFRNVMGSDAGAIPQGGDSLPVAGVSWDQANEFCRRLGERERRSYRLPSEIEWEFACRAGTTTSFNGNGRLDDLGWYAGNSSGKLHPVASKAPNHWGLFDMHGNVEEWCSDVYFNPGNSGNGKWRLVRGGTIQDMPEACRSFARRGQMVIAPMAMTGFRVALDPPTAH